MNRSTTLFLIILLSCLGPTGSFGQKVISYVETFEKRPPYWSFSQPYHDANNDREYYDGALSVDHRGTGSYWIFKSIPVAKSTDWTISMKCRIDRSETTGGFGIHVLANTYHYYFKIAGTLGSYWVGHYNEADKSWNTWSKTAPDGTADVPCSCIRPNGQVNNLVVQRLGNSISFSINDTKVEELNVQTLPAMDTNVVAFGINVSQKVTGVFDEIRFNYTERPIGYHANALKGATKTFIPELNAQLYDRFSIVAPNGNSIYWVRTSEGKNDDIFTAMRSTDSTWTSTKNIGPPLNNSEPNNVTSVSQDDNELFIWGLYKSDGSWDGPGFSTVRRSATGWEPNKRMTITNYVNLSASREECVSADRRVALFACQRTETYGGKDLYISFLKDDNYSEPVNLGASLNSAWEEGMPYLAADNKTLYFSSLRPGFGNSDIWVSKRLDDTWLKWSPPINMGPHVNTSGWDAYFSIHPSGKYAYMNSSDGYREGITRLRITRDKESRELLPDPVVLARGKVLNAKTKSPIGTTIQIDDIRKETHLATALSEPREGKYSIVLPVGKAYGFFASAEGYFPVSENVILDTLSEFLEIERDLYLQPIEVGAVIRMNNLFFDYDKAVLRSESKSELDRLIALLRSHPSMKIELGGHTDDRGNDSYNKDLSDKRASAVMAYLVKQGIDKSRMTSKGYGKSKPVIKGVSEEARRQNRRVEFAIKSM